jgi:hypothetical protein
MVANVSKFEVPGWNILEFMMFGRLGGKGLANQLINE